MTAAPVAVTVDDDETPAPGLALTLTVEHEDADGSGDVTLGDELEYTARATNSGNVELAEVKVSDLRVDPAGQECATLAVGAVCELTGTYTVTQADVDAGEVSNTAQASAGGVTALPASEVTAVAQERALGLAVSARPSSFARVGDEITYTYTVTNSGTVTLAGTVTVVDDTATGIECAALPAGGLAPAGTTTCTGSYTTVQADVDAGEVTNRATASVDEVTSAAATATVGWRAGELNQGAVLSITGVQVAESAGEVGFVVSLSPSSVQTVTVGYATANGTAEASLDYTGTSGTLTFGPGATARTIAVAVIDDELKEEKESFALELSEPWNATLLGSVEKLSGSATITDDDAEPEITSGSALTVAEGRTAIREWTVHRDRRGPRDQRADVEHPGGHGGRRGPSAVRDHERGPAEPEGGAGLREPRRRGRRPGVRGDRAGERRSQRGDRGAGGDAAGRGARGDGGGGHRDGRRR